MSLGRCGDVDIAATGLEEISDEACDEIVDHTLELDAQRGLAKGGLQYTPERTPSPAQRRRIAARQQVGDYVRMAIVTESPVARGAITVLAWLFKSQAHTRAFAPSEARQALEWLNEAASFDLEQGLSMLKTVIANVGLPLPKGL